ncbi:hypothetical protein EMIT0196MI5_10258 [Pseudomonas sp. IT-196MI5]
MNTSTQPSEGAGGSRSRAAGELTLGLLSGEKRRVYADLPLLFCRSWLASEGDLPADPVFADAPNPCRSWPAMAARQPTDPSQMYPIQLWERACSR